MQFNYSSIILLVDTFPFVCSMLFFFFFWSFNSINSLLISRGCTVMSRYERKMSHNVFCVPVRGISGTT